VSPHVGPKNETAGPPEESRPSRFDGAAKGRAGQRYIYIGAGPPPLALGVTAKLTF
jgi:hypothetical protein